MLKRAMNLATLVAAIALTALAAAQGKMDPFDYHAANLRLLENKAVQKELGVTESQRALMNRHADTYRSQLQAYGNELKAKKVDPKTMKGPDARVKTIMETLKRNVMGILTAGQLKRLREISLQAVGLVGVLDDQVARKVGLKPDQLKKLRQTYKDGSQRASALVKKEIGGALEEFRGKRTKTEAEKQQLELRAKEKVQAAEKRVAPQVEKIRADTRTRMLSLLSKQQKDTYLALQGKRFDGGA